MTNKKHVYSGIRATGRLHLGNYLGAVKGMLALQDEYDCVFSVVDLHAITTPYSPKSLQHSIREVVLDFLGAGLDPKKCLIEVQSKVPQHTELSFLLATIYPVARLEDLPTYKEKKAQYPKYVNTGLLYYPVLMAADVLLYKGELVPVGIDQEPHLEVMREIARKFNGMFGQTFPEPQRFKTKGEKVPSLTGEGKMSKTVEGSYITLTDDLETIKAKVAKIPTDLGRAEKQEVAKGITDKGFHISDSSLRAGVHNTSPDHNFQSLMTFVSLFQGDERKNDYIKQYNNEGVKYSKIKEELADAIYRELQPFQKRRKEFENNPQLVDKILEESAEKCRERADVTMKEVKEKMGLI